MRYILKVRGVQHIKTIHADDWQTATANMRFWRWFGFRVTVRRAA